MSRENTVYVIKRNINLKGKTIVVPKGCVLEFTKGKLRNGTIIGNGTRINAGKKQIFENIEINPKGTWNNHKGYPEWFGASDRPSMDSKMAIQRAIDVADTCVLSQYYYTSFDTPTGRGDSPNIYAIAINNKVLLGLANSKVIVDAKFSNTERTSVFWVGDNVTIDGVNIEYINENKPKNRLFIFMDKDKQGDKATSEIKNAFPLMENAHDFINITPYKDINDFYMATLKKGY